MTLCLWVFLASSGLLSNDKVHGFIQTTNKGKFRALDSFHAKPKRLSENVDGVLYVNDQVSAARGRSQ